VSANGAEPMADVTPEGWDRRLDFGGDLALLHYPNGEWRFRHRCDRGERGVIVCAPLLSHDHSVGVDELEPHVVTVAPSILCPDCGTHGWVVRSEWRGA